MSALDMPTQFERIRNYRRIIAEYPFPADKPIEVTEVWFALCEAYEALDALVSLDQGCLRSGISETRGAVDMTVSKEAHTRAMRALERLWS